MANRRRIEDYLNNILKTHKEGQTLDDTDPKAYPGDEFKAIQQLLESTLIEKDDGIYVVRESNDREDGIRKAHRRAKYVQIIKKYHEDWERLGDKDVLLDFKIEEANGEFTSFKIKHGRGNDFFSIYKYANNPDNGKRLISITNDGKVICDDIETKKSIKTMEWEEEKLDGEDKSKNKIRVEGLMSQALITNKIYGKQNDNLLGKSAIDIDGKGTVNFNKRVFFNDVSAGEIIKFPADGKWYIIKSDIQQFDMYRFYCSSNNTYTLRKHLSDFLISVGGKKSIISSNHRFYSPMNNLFFMRWLMKAKIWNKVKLRVEGNQIHAKADCDIFSNVKKGDFIYGSITKVWDDDSLNDSIEAIPAPKQ